MYLTFGSFIASLLSIILSFVLGVDPFVLSLFVIIVGIVGLVLAYEFENATGKYINGLLKRTHLDKVQLALVKLARNGATPSQRRRVSEIFDFDNSQEDCLEKLIDQPLITDGYKDAVLIRQRAMV